MVKGTMAPIEHLKLLSRLPDPDALTPLTEDLDTNVMAPPTSQAGLAPPDIPPLVSVAMLNTKLVHEKVVAVLTVHLILVSGEVNESPV